MDSGPLSYARHSSRSATRSTTYGTLTTHGPLTCNGALRVSRSAPLLRRGAPINGPLQLHGTTPTHRPAHPIAVRHARHGPLCIIGAALG